MQKQSLPLPIEGKEMDEAVHTETVTELSEGDRAFLASFTDMQKKKVMWKVTLSTHAGRNSSLVSGRKLTRWSTARHQTRAHARVPLPHRIP